MKLYTKIALGCFFLFYIIDLFFLRWMDEPARGGLTFLVIIIMFYLYNLHEDRIKQLEEKVK